MINVQDFKPERDFKVNEKITIEDVKRAKETNETITGVPVSYNLITACVRVYIGNDIYASLPFGETSLEEIEKDVALPVQVKGIMRRNKIRVKVTSVEGNKIVLSRKSNLEEVFSKISKIQKGVYNASIENIDRHNIFFDIAEGVCGYCNVCQLTKIYIDNLHDWISIGEHINVRVTEISKSEHLVWCSAKKAAFGDYKRIKPGSRVMARVGSAIKNDDGVITGYFVEITPAISGIADIRSSQIGTFEQPKFGEKVRCYVRSVNSKQHRVKLYID